MSWKQIKSGLEAADRVFDKGATVLIVAGGIMVALTVVLQVVLRYVFKVPLFGLEEFSRLIAVWVYFLGAIFGTRLDSHVQGDVAARLFSTSRAKAVVKTAAWCVSLVVCALLVYHVAKYCIWLYGTGERTTGLWWPRIYSVGSMFFGAVFMTLYSIVNLIKYSLTATQASKQSAGGSR